MLVDLRQTRFRQQVSNSNIIPRRFPFSSIKLIHPPCLYLLILYILGVPRNSTSLSSQVFVPGALANSKWGSNTLYCNGCIIDTTQNIFPKIVPNVTVLLSLGNLKCCEGDRFEGLGDTTTCSVQLQERPLTAEVSGPRYGTEVATLWTDVVGYQQTPYCLWFSRVDIALQTSAGGNGTITNGPQTPALATTGIS